MAWPGTQQCECPSQQQPWWKNEPVPEEYAGNVADVFSGRNVWLMSVHLLWCSFFKKGFKKTQSVLFEILLNYIIKLMAWSNYIIKLRNKQKREKKQLHSMLLKLNLVLQLQLDKWNTKLHYAWLPNVKLRPFHFAWSMGVHIPPEQFWISPNVLFPNTAVRSVRPEPHELHASLHDAAAREALIAISTLY